MSISIHTGKPAVASAEDGALFRTTSPDVARVYIYIYVWGGYD